MVYSVARLPVIGPRTSASMPYCNKPCKQGILPCSSLQTPALAVGGKSVKLATVFLASLVALLLVLPVPVAAAPLTPLRQTDQTGETPATPTPEVAEASSIIDLHATAGRLRGRIELGWSVLSPADSPDAAVPASMPGGSVFVVERSTNGSSWRPVKACYLPFDGEAEAYACTDARLASGTTYAYRVCLAGKPTTCSNAVTTSPISVKAP